MAAADPELARADGLATAAQRLREAGPAGVTRRYPLGLGSAAPLWPEVAGLWAKSAVGRACVDLADGAFQASPHARMGFASCPTR
jgi:hypothetical protein